VRYIGVKASRGKFTRAEPVAALYEQDRIHHAGRLDKLEDQMCEFTPDFDRKTQGYSPDRVDALVWAYTELFPGLVQRVEREEEPEDDAWEYGRNAVGGY
jgi:phage terminase large subunit-like protein